MVPSTERLTGRRVWMGRDFTGERDWVHHLPQAAIAEMEARVADLRAQPALPNVPTMQGAGVAGCEAAAWVAYSAPRATPAPIVERMNAELNEVLRKPEVIARLQSWGADPAGGSAASMAAALREERARRGEAVRRRHRGGVMPAA